MYDIPISLFHKQIILMFLQYQMLFNIQGKTHMTDNLPIEAPDTTRIGKLLR